MVLKERKKILYLFFFPHHLCLWPLPIVGCIFDHFCVTMNEWTLFYFCFYFGGVFLPFYSGNTQTRFGGEITEANPLPSLSLLKNKSPEKIIFLKASLNKFILCLVLPYIEAKGARDLTAVATDRVKFDVAIFGEPVPDVTWSRGEESVDEEHKLDITAYS